MQWSCLSSFGLPLLLLFGIFKSVYQIEQHLDIVLYDETIRLFKGVHFNFDLQLFREFFAYELWYALQSLFVSDAMHLYAINYILLSSLCAFLIYIYVGQKRGYDLITLWLSLIFLVSIINYKAWLYNHRLALSIALLVLIFIENKQAHNEKWLSIPLQWTLVSLGALALFYIRIEYIVLVGIISMGLIYKFSQFLFNKKKKSPKSSRGMLPKNQGNQKNKEILVYTGLLAILLPMATFHDSWIIGSQFAHEKFGQSASVSQAFLYNPI